MKTRTISSWCFLLCFFCTTTHLCFAADTLSSGQSLYHNQTLVSAQGNFELGYYQPGTASKYYIAIWYKKISVQTKTSVWMANRDDPLTDPASAELKLLESGNLVIFNQSKNQVWSTNLTFKGTNLSELVLGDDGNLVLRDGSNPSMVFWQSFDYPTDTWLPGGKLRYDNKTKLPTLLTSWKNSEDPAQGMYSVQLDPIGKQYNMFWNRSEQYWSSGPWDGQIFSLVPEMTLNYIFDFSYISNENESYFTYDIYKYNKSIFSRCVLSLSGQVTQLTWLDNSQSWNMFWAQPRMKCALNGFCGANSLCNESDLCQCLPGFEPHSSIDWNAGKTSGGCVRKTPLQCNDKEGFWQMANIRYPENDTKASGVENDQDCKMACLNNCSCIAYCSSYRRGCLTWDLDRLNFQQLLVRNSSGGDLYLRLAASELQSLGGDHKDHARGHKDNARVIIITTVVTGVVVVVGALMYISWRRNANLKGKKKKKYMKNLLFHESNDIRESSDPGEFKDNPELPIFNFEKLAVATNEFDAENKIGQGGFGPVYKGKLLDGQEIAVKRLSKSSGQGLEEFKNEVVVISKLQHRNLVRILGYCIQGDEKMLIYEYMPNKSLDSFIFDSTKKTILDWRMRFEIVIGICRGLTYLHRDSRLRVIHRDLKASNILLDHDLKPKISDFGMARIFGGDELQANTLRVVGTYGYMSPEYAMKGVFSEKSDVYSFGVLLLELVSGKKNTSFYHHKQFWSLVGYAWNLWSEGKTEELIDPVISVSSDKEQILRCVHVGLLCVQDFAKDRPTIPSIILMLTSETPSLAIPEQPVYTGREVAPDSDLLEENCKMFSRNNVSFTTLEGR